MSRVICSCSQGALPLLSLCRLDRSKAHKYMYRVCLQSIVPRILLECLKQICGPPEDTTVEISVVLYQTVFDLLLNYGGDIYALAPRDNPEFEDFTVSFTPFSLSPSLSLSQRSLSHS